MNSILTYIKKILGIEESFTQFDADIIMGINTAFSSLSQLGVGPTAGFSVMDNTAEWSAFIGDNKILESVKSYIYLKTRLVFDPPTSSFLLDAIERQIKEIEWRLYVLSDLPITDDEGDKDFEESPSFWFDEVQI